MAVEHDRSGTRLEETKRVARILHMVQLISAQPQIWTRRKLATKFELSERMIANDLEIIRHRLCYALHRSRRGYYFVDGPFVKPIQLSLSETLALALAAQQARNTGSVDAGVIASALAHLEAYRETSRYV